MGSTLIPLEVLRYWRTHARQDVLEPDAILTGEEIMRGATWSVPPRFARESEYGHMQFGDDYSMRNVSDGVGE